MIPCLATFCGYLPKAHPANTTGRYTQSRQAGDVLHVNLNDIEMLLDVDAETVIRDCGVDIGTWGDDPDEHKKSREAFLTTHGRAYLAVMTKSGRYVYARATLEDFSRALTYKAEHLNCSEIDLDDLPS